MRTIREVIRSEDGGDGPPLMQRTRSRGATAVAGIHVAKVAFAVNKSNQLGQIRPSFSVPLDSPVAHKRRNEPPRIA